VGPWCSKNATVTLNFDELIKRNCIGKSYTVTLLNCAKKIRLICANNRFLNALRITKTTHFNQKILLKQSRQQTVV
jgi:hypothetical protein